jgi:hypothetical protein
MEELREIIATLYRRAMLIYFLVLTTALIAVCILMTALAILDNALRLGWGYPWWSIFIILGLIAILLPLRRLSRMALRTYW